MRDKIKKRIELERLESLEARQCVRIRVSNLKNVLEYFNQLLNNSKGLFV